MINYDKIGTFFSKSLTIEEVPTNKKKEIIDIVKLHNKLVTKIDEGSYKEEDYKTFIKYLAKERVDNSLFLIKLCNFYLETSEQLFITEFKHLEETGILLNNNMPGINFIMANIVEVNRKTNFFMSKFVDGLTPTTYSSLYVKDQLQVLNNLLSELNDKDSATYQYYKETFTNFINSTFLTTEFKNFFLENENIIYNKIISRLWFKIRNCSSYIDSSNNIYFKENKYRELCLSIRKH